MRGKIRFMVNYLPLSSHLLTGGSPTLPDLADLRAQGVEVVINLALATSPDAIPDEAAEVAKLGMQYIHIPVIWETPTLENLQDFFAAYERCAERITFIHCVKNMRVSAFVYLYRVLRQSADPQEAYYDMAQIWEPEGTWATFIETAFKSHQA
jgi:protein tyrosine phosphatase (PTP) superfamily phosphohydrolase (DUF442 family)